MSNIDANSSCSSGCYPQSQTTTAVAKPLSRDEGYYGERNFSEKHRYNCTGDNIGNKLAILRRLAQKYCEPHITYSIVEGSDERSHCKISILSGNGIRIESQWSECYCQAWFQHESAILYRTISEQERLLLAQLN